MITADGFNYEDDKSMSMGDFGIDRSPSAVSAELRRVGYDPHRVVRRDLVDPGDVDPSEWNSMGADEEKVRRYAEGWDSHVPAALLIDDGWRYRAVDGLHRARAAEMAGERLPALLIGPDVYEEIANFGDAAMHEWAHEVAP